uniref:Uncharacterized protein n=1 Tax=uncultured marine virus TaxID=186617 RepID=A0A0F7L7B8_9VIRU|nr:hypothetical protein [uncultured marine virus]
MSGNARGWFRATSCFASPPLLLPLERLRRTGQGSKKSAVVRTSARTSADVAGLVSVDRLSAIV